MSIKESIVKFGTKTLNQLKVHSPAILIGGGIVAGVAAGVVACIETHKKLDGVIAEHKEKVAAIKDIRDGVVVLDEYTTEEYATKYYKKHLFEIFLQTICKLGKIYFPAFLLAIASIISILSGAKVLNKRYIAAVAEAVLTKRTFTEYRKRVAGVVGEEAEKLLYVNGEKTIVKDTEIDPETGELKEVLKEAVVGPDDVRSHTYIVSKETVNNGLYGISDADFRRRLQIGCIDPANQYFRMHGQVKLGDFMSHYWKDDYLYQNEEIFSDGWIDNDQFAMEGYDKNEPVTCDVKMINAPNEDRKYAVTFNVQCNVINALALQNSLKKKEKKLKKKAHATIRPAVA